MDATEIHELAANIATALAAGLVTFEEVPGHFNVNPEVWDEFKFNPAFKRVYDEAKTIWSGDLNSSKRVKLKALAMLEDSLPVLHKIMYDDSIHVSNRLEAVKQTARLAGAEQQEAAAAGVGAPFRLEINIGTEDGMKTISLGGDDQSTEAIPSNRGLTEALPVPSMGDNWELGAGLNDEES